MTENQFIAYRIKTDITFSPTNVRGEKLSKVDFIIDPMPNKLDVLGEGFLRNGDEYESDRRAPFP